MEERFIIKIDKVNGTVAYENPEGLSNFEVLGSMEIVKMLIASDFMEGDE